VKIFNSWLYFDSASASCHWSKHQSPHCWSLLHKNYKTWRTAYRERVGHAPQKTGEYTQ